MQTASTIRLATLLLFTSSYAGPQLPQPGISLGRVGLQLDMAKQEALKKLSMCCKTISLGGAAVIVTDKADINRGLGTVYFADSKVSGIAADAGWSPEAASYETALALYRLVEERTHDSPARMTVYAYSRDMSSATNKYVVMQFADGRRIRIEIANRISAPNHTQVVVSKCVGNCSDW